MERPSSVLSEEVYDLAEVLDYPRPKATLSRSYGRPAVPTVGEMRFPVISPTHAAAGPQLSGHMQRRKAMLELNNAGIDAEARNRQNLELVPIFDVKNKEQALENAKVAAIKAELSTPSQRMPWKEERELRIQNAMVRVQQSYVSNVKTLYNTDVNNSDNKSHYSPKYLDPIKPKNQVIWDEDRFRRSRKATERIQKNYVDELRPAPVLPQARRISRQEIEIDEKRTDLMAQRRAADVDRAIRNANVHAAYESEYDRKSMANDMRAHHAPHVPMPPTAPNGENGYSKRKRKLKVADPVTLRPADIVPAPPTATANQTGYTRPVQESVRMRHEFGGNDESYWKFEQEQKAELRNANHKAANNAAEPQLALIPRQMSQNIRSWNSETAKRGLGFKSKLKRATEDAAAGPVTGSKSEKISAEARNKWKKATFY